MIDIAIAELNPATATTLTSFHKVVDSHGESNSAFRQGLARLLRFGKTIVSLLWAS